MNATKKGCYFKFDECDNVPAKAFWEPVRTIAPTVSSLSKARMAAVTSRMTSSFRALRALGRFKVMKPTFSLISVRMVLYVGAAAPVDPVAAGAKMLGERF